MSASQIGQNAKEIRKRRKLSVADVAQRLGINEQTLYKWEDGTRDIPVEFVYPLAQMYEVSTDYLLNFHNYNKTKSEMQREWSLISRVCDYFMRHNTDKHRNTMRIILTIINEWDGDFDSLVNMSAMYAAMSPLIRKDIAGLCLHSFAEERKQNKIDPDLSELIDIELLRNRCEAFDDKMEKTFIKTIVQKQRAKEDYDL